MTEDICKIKKMLDQGIFSYNIMEDIIYHYQDHPAIIPSTILKGSKNKSTAASDLDGIMYPSVWGQGQGMNVCLKKEVVDESVHFQMASVQYIEKRKGESQIFGVAESYLCPNGDLK